MLVRRRARPLASPRRRPRPRRSQVAVSHKSPAQEEAVMHVRAYDHQLLVGRQQQARAVQAPARAAHEQPSCGRSPTPTPLHMAKTQRPRAQPEGVPADQPRVLPEVAVAAEENVGIRPGHRLPAACSTAYMHSTSHRENIMDVEVHRRRHRLGAGHPSTAMTIAVQRHGLRQPLPVGPTQSRADLRSGGDLPQRRRRRARPAMSATASP